MHNELTYRKNSYTLKAFALLYCHMWPLKITQKTPF